MNRQLGMEDYMGMLRRQKWWIIVPAVIAPVLGLLVSYAIPAKYTSTSAVLVEAQQIQGVAPIVTADLLQRMVTMEQQILSTGRLKPMIERLSLAKGDDADGLMGDIRANLSIQPMDADLAKTAVAATRKKPSPGTPDIAGFNVEYTASNPIVAQKICGELTSMLLEENLKQRERVAQGSTTFFSKQLVDSKQSLDQMDAKLAGFKRQYLGQLPGDEESNLRILMGLNSQLDASTQALNRAQQDKTFAEGALAQQLTAWRASLTATSPQALDQQMATLQGQLLQAESRYTEDHPDVIKLKRDVAELKKKMDQASAATVTAEDTQKASASEPPEIRQLRLQIHQYDQVISAATRDQTRLQQQIVSYQGKVAISPAVEEQYKVLTRDYDTAQKNYQDLLTKRDASETTQEVEKSQLGEQLQLLGPADLPDAPSFPKRWLFALGGLAAGLTLGFGLAFVFEMKDDSIRTEPDVEAVLELPTLIALPWVGLAGQKDHGYVNSAFWRNSKDAEKESVEV
ncbi:MAG TPA: Wzz/FepE/Etk N-terminal domain-containing protein [Candidatus Angelobacter sp.]|nr:Wzz/FepE/Etk N-terminal domain-containing protein [Candidatus Angelobacter sp.]